MSFVQLHDRSAGVPTRSNPRSAEGWFEPSSGPLAYWLLRVSTPALRRSLGEQFTYQFAVDVREAEVAALETEGELFVVEAKEVENCGVQIVDVDAVGN